MNTPRNIAYHQCVANVKVKSLGQVSESEPCTILDITGSDSLFLYIKFTYTLYGEFNVHM
jgi:hypothetical protein